MRKVLLILSFFFTVLVSKSQNLTIEGTAPDLYITHTVAPKENFYSIGRLYNQAPKSIATFNNITMEKGLTIGQHVKIPLNTQNFNGTGDAGSGETLIPLTHIVAKGETLFKISSDLNVTPEMLKKWNNLSADNIAPGTPLVVGNLKIKSDQQLSAVAKSNPNASVNSEVAPVKSEPASEPKQIVAEEKKEEPAVAVNSTVTDQPKEAEQPVVTPQVTGQVNVASISATPKEEPKTEDVPSRKISSSALTGTNSVEGFFASNFSSVSSQKSLNNKSGEAATFKSTSGWQDKKYYVLINDITPGTIVKISSGDNKVVYAKVLGSMPEIKENNGLLLRISSAAASSLGIIDPRFPVEVSYYQ